MHTPPPDRLRSTTTTTTSLFLTLNLQISHHLQIARLIEAGGVKTAQDLLQVVGVKKVPYL